MNGIIGGLIFGSIGAVIKWCYSKIASLFTKKRAIPFSEIYAGEKEINDYDAVMNSLSNQAAGIAFIMALVVLILILNL